MHDISGQSSTTKKYGKKTKLKPLGGMLNFSVFMTGTAIAATGYSFSLTGSFYMGIFTEIIAGLWCFLSALGLFNAAVITGSTSFIDLGRKRFGNKGYRKIYPFIMVTLPTLISNFGALAVYIQISSDAVQSYMTINTVYIQVIFAIIVFLLGIIRSYDNTTIIAGIVFVCFSITVGTIVGIGVVLMGELELQSQRQFDLLTYVQAIPVISFGLNGIASLPGQAGEMEPRHQKIFPYYFFVGEFIIVCSNSLVGTFPSVLFGECTQSNSIVNLNCWFNWVFNYNSVPIIIAQITLATGLIIQTPIYSVIMKEFVLDRNGRTVRDWSWSVNALCSLVIAFISAMLGIVLGNVTDTLNLVGTVGSLLMVGPTSALIALSFEKGMVAKIRGYIVMIVGIIFMIINFYTMYQTIWPPEVSADAPNCECVQVVI